MSNHKQLWHSIAREAIPWFPAVNQDKCIGCEMCIVPCRPAFFRALQVFAGLAFPQGHQRQDELRVTLAQVSRAMTLNANGAARLK